ncbi:MAG: 50S ribosomal protein L11 [Nanoarchaeota archaeon]
MSEIINLMVDGGELKPGPTIAQPLAGKQMNIQQIITDINSKTTSFKGMKVPIELKIEDDKSYAIKVGTPPISELIKKEIGIEKGSGTPNKNKVGNLAIEQIVKLAIMKQDSLLFNNFKSAVKIVAGSCNSLGVLIEGRSAREINDEINLGNYDSIINSQETEVSKEKQNLLNQQLKEIQERIKKEMEKAEAEKKAEEAKSKKLVTEAEKVVEEAATEKKEGEAEKKVEEKPAKEVKTEKKK